MRLRTALLVMTAVGLTVSGMVRSVRRRMSFYRRNKGFVLVKADADQRMSPLYFSIWVERSEEMLCEEVYYSFTSIYVPSRVLLTSSGLDWAYLDRLNCRVWKSCEGLLGGARMRLVRYVNPRYAWRQDGSFTIERGHRIIDFSSRYGISAVRIAVAMNEARRTLFRCLVEDGRMREEDFE